MPHSDLSGRPVIIGLPIAVTPTRPESSFCDACGERDLCAGRGNPIFATECEEWAEHVEERQRNRAATNGTL